MRVRWPVVLAWSLLLPTGCASAADQRADDTREAPDPSSATGRSSEVRPPAAPRSSGSSTAPASKGTRVVVDDSDFGPMLYSAEGQAIYLFDLEDSPRPRCYDDCAVEWPPVLTDGEPVAGRGARTRLLGTVGRDDGTTQVTYAGHPLYFYAHEGPHEVLCHDFFEFGGTWYVVQPAGSAAP